MTDPRAAAMTERHRVLGIDAALYASGLVLLEEAGTDEMPRVVRASVSKLPRNRSWAEHLAELDDTIPLLTYRVSLAVIEKPGRWARASGRSRQETVEGLAMARGVCLLRLHREGLRSPNVVVVDVNEARVQTLGIGSHKGAKEEVQEMLRRVGVHFEGPNAGDLYDAYVLADYGLRLLSGRVEELLR